MLNPENKREIIFNDELQQLFGCESAVMTQISTLLVPHMDVGGGPVEPVKVKTTAVKKHKRECATPMKSQKREAKAEFSAKLSPKSENTVKTDVSNVASSPPQKSEGSPPIKRLKAEFDMPCSTVTPSDVEEASAAIQPRLMAISRESATVAFTAPSGAFRFHAVATPQASIGAVNNGVWELCRVEVRETPSGDFEQHAKAELTSLDPGMAYRVSVRVSAALAGSNDSGCEADSQSVALPQRARPKEWAPHEALLWASSLQIPALSTSMSQYGIDGTTLLSLTEEDLRGLGLSAPFLLRRVLTALEALRAA